MSIPPRERKAGEKKGLFRASLPIPGVFFLLCACLAFPNGDLALVRDTGLHANAFVYPIVAAKFSSGFGVRKHPLYKAYKHHRGIDLAAPHDAPIRSIREGTIVFADSYAGYGKLVVVLHHDGITSHYGHCQSILVDVGEKIPAGHIIATVGSTGKVTGPHLHFEIRKNGVEQNPEQYLPGLKSQALG